MLPTIKFTIALLLSSSYLFSSEFTYSLKKIKNYHVMNIAQYHNRTIVGTVDCMYNSSSKVGSIKNFTLSKNIPATVQHALFNTALSFFIQRTGCSYCKWLPQWEKESNPLLNAFFYDKNNKTTKLYEFIDKVWLIKDKTTIYLRPYNSSLPFAGELLNFSGIKFIQNSSEIICDLSKQKENIFDLYVHENNREQGLGKFFVHISATLLKNYGMNEMQWIASSFGEKPLSHQQLIQFYQKCGGILTEKDCYDYQWMKMNLKNFKQYPEVKKVMFKLKK